MNRFATTVHRNFSTTAFLCLPKYGGDSQSFQPPEGAPRRKFDRGDPHDQSFRRPEGAPRRAFDRDRDRFEARRRSDIVPRNENDFNDSPGLEKRKVQRWRQRENFRRVLEHEAGADDVAEKLAQQPPPDKRFVRKFLTEETRRERSIMLSDMARRKYYNYPIEDNLLTWKAKEQIFQLRQSDPETWTPEQLAESFPISIEGVKRLLKSKWPPAPTGDDEEEVIRRHDDEVRRRWILLKVRFVF